jgi:hypothetical protein
MLTTALFPALCVSIWLCQFALEQIWEAVLCCRISFWYFEHFLCLHKLSKALLQFSSWRDIFKKVFLFFFWPSVCSSPLKFNRTFSLLSFRFFRIRITSKVLFLVIYIWRFNKVLFLVIYIWRFNLFVFFRRFWFFLVIFKRRVISCSSFGSLIITIEWFFVLYLLHYLYDSKKSCFWNSPWKKSKQ